MNEKNPRPAAKQQKITLTMCLLALGRQSSWWNSMCRLIMLADEYGAEGKNDPVAMAMLNGETKIWKGRNLTGAHAVIDALYEFHKEQKSM